MSCEICGRGACTRSFHSLEEQESFDGIADEVKQRTVDGITRAVNMVDYEYIGDDVYVKLDDVLGAIRSY